MPSKFEEYLWTNSIVAVSREFGVPVSQLLDEDKDVTLALLAKAREIAHLCRDMHKQGYMRVKQHSVSHD